jgi:hypothetical protein
MKRLLMVTCAVLVLAGNGFALEEPGRKYDWGFGWDNGLTLRRNFDRWQVGVSGGPNDFLRDQFRHEFDTDLPDSLQGVLTDSDHTRRESGFVRLHLARDVHRQEKFLFQGVLSGSYSWTDYKEEYQDYYYGQEGGEAILAHRIEESFTQNWSLLVGLRLTWFPVPYLSLEHEFGLVYLWENIETESTRFDERDHRLSRDVLETRRQYFEDFGPSSLTSNIQIVFWF